MSPESAEAIRIADKHLPDAPPQQRMLLAQDIVAAIVRLAIPIATDIRKDAMRAAVPAADGGDK